MDAWLETVRDVWDGPVDFEGQKMVEFASVATLSGVGALAFIFGLITQDITTTLYLGLGGSALAFLFTIPPWPIYNKHPVPWLTATSSMSAPTMNIVVDGKKVE